MKNIEKVKEKHVQKKGMKEKVQAAPKALVRRGLEDGTQRLRGQLRDAAQGGRSDDYGGDRIEDAAAGGTRWAARGIESFLKKKKKSGNRKTDNDYRISDNPFTDPETPDTPPRQETGDRPRIKTREYPSIGDGSETAGPASGLQRDHPRIKTRKAVTHSAPTDMEPVPQAKQPQIRIGESDRHTPLSGEMTAAPADGSALNPFPQAGREHAQIKTRESGISGSNLLPDGVGKPAISKSDCPVIKTKEAYIQRQTSSSPEQTAQIPIQGRREFVQEQGRRSAIKRAEAQRTVNVSVPQGGGGEDAAPSVPAWRRYASERRGYDPPRPAQRPVSPRNSDTRSGQGTGKRLFKTAQSARKAPERTARHAIKAAERSSRKAVKTAQRTAKTAEKTVKTAQKTAQTTVKATQRAVQAARAAAKTAVEAVKAAVEAAKAAVEAAHELSAAIAAGGWVAVVVILVICLGGLLIASTYGIFFADGGNAPDAVSPTAAVSQINRELADTLSSLQAGGGYDSVEIRGRSPSWVDVFAVFSVKTVTEGGVDVAVLDEDRVERLRTVFWDMTKITTEITTIEHPATEDAEAWTETVLTITITPRTTDDMRVFYRFTQQQNEALDELLTAEARAMWQELLYGDGGEIAAAALP